MTLVWNNLRPLVAIFSKPLVNSEATLVWDAALIEPPLIDAKNVCQERKDEVRFQKGKYFKMQRGEG